MDTVRPRLPAWFGQYVDYLKNVSESEFVSRFSPNEGGRIKRQQDKNTTLIEYKGERPITSEAEALEFFEIDTKKWKVKRWICNSWDVTMRLPDGDTKKRTNYQVKLWLEPHDRKKRKADLEFKAKLLARVKPFKINSKRKPGGKFAVEIDIKDLHLGKKGFNCDTLKFNWSLEEAGAQYEKAVNTVLKKVDVDQIEQFIFPVGDDLININSTANSTVKGTPQMTGQFFQTIFTYTHVLVSKVIASLSIMAPVFVYMVPGNHDADAVFHLGEVLEARFKGNKNVTIDSRPIVRKYHRYGKNLIGFSHGEKIKPTEVFNAMSVDVPGLFAESKYRFFRLGHLHKNQKRKKFDLTVKDEFHGVDVEICPSLSPTDLWHYQHLYAGNMRRSKSFVYDKNHGLVQEIYYNM